MLTEAVAGRMTVLNAILISGRPAMGFVIIGLYWGSFAAMVPQIKADLGADDALFGLMLLGTSAGLSLTMILAPWLDKTIGRWSMPVSAILFAGAFLTPGLAQTPFQFFVAMCLCGLCSGLLDVIMNARVSDLEELHSRPLMNANHGMFSLAYVVGATTAGLWREADASTVTVFASLAIVPVLSVLWLRMTPAAAGSGEGLPKKLPMSLVLIAGAVVMLAFMGEASVEAWSALHIERTLNMGAVEGALGPAMLGLTMAVGRFGGQAISERFRDLHVIIFGAGLGVIGALVAAIAPSAIWAYLGFGILGLGVSVIGPLGLAIAGRLAPPEARTKAVSRVAVIGFMGFFLAPAAMGLISDAFGLRIAFVAIAVMVALLFPLVAALRRIGA